jgi:AraC family transcriptional regulator
MRVDLIDLTGPSELPEKALPEHVLITHVDGPARTDIWLAGTARSVDGCPGELCVLPAETPYAVRRDLPGRIVATLLNTHLLEQTADEGQRRRRIDLEPRLGARDPLLDALSRALTEEVLNDNAGGPLYAETLGAALAAQLWRNHAGGSVPLRRRGGLASNTLRALTEYIEAHLAEPIRLQELANLAGMSTYQLARRFKESQGVPPHQYLLRRRIERAREMLRQPDSTILDVALSCGFASQSHFASAFRMLTGVTPRRYRDSL